VVVLVYEQHCTHTYNTWPVTEQDLRFFTDSVPGKASSSLGLNILSLTSVGIQKVLKSRHIKAATKLKEVHILKTYFISHDKLIAFSVYGIIFQ
jgi:hypothetical protein